MAESRFRALRTGTGSNQRSAWGRDPATHGTKLRERIIPAANNLQVFAAQKGPARPSGAFSFDRIPTSAHDSFRQRIGVPCLNVGRHSELRLFIPGSFPAYRLSASPRLASVPTPLQVFSPSRYFTGRFARACESFLRSGWSSPYLPECVARTVVSEFKFRQFNQRS
jgi:hypothetical protein